MERWKGRVALVTGASMGIGEAICRMLVSHGMKVVACARSEDKLKNIAANTSGSPGEILPVKCDLRQKDDIEKMFHTIKDHWGGVDVCINNAGLALGPSIIEGDSDEWDNMWQVNVMALCLCTQAAVKSMREREVDDGHIINMNSLSGQRVGKSHFYSATKYAVTALTEGIRWELRGINSHIRISSISPGLVKSHFHAVQVGEEEARHIYETKQLPEVLEYAEMQFYIMTLLDVLGKIASTLQGEDISSIVEYILASPPHVQIHEVMVRPTEQVV